MTNELPSVQCEGWWEQDWLGRQPMEQLTLSFGDGQIQGAGTDVVGLFTIAGEIGENGTVAMIKNYVGQHNVEYFGRYDGEGTMAGEWRVDGMVGPWMIRINRSTQSVAIEEITEVG